MESIRFIIIYGHHMSDRTAFAEFADFIDEDFAREHSHIIVYKRSGQTLELEACAVYVVNASRESLVIEQESLLSDIAAGTELILREPGSEGQLFRLHCLLVPDKKLKGSYIRKRVLARVSYTIYNH